MGEDVSGTNGLRGAGEDDAAFVEDVGPVDDVEHAFDVVLNDHDGRLEPLADLGDSLNLFEPLWQRVAMSGQPFVDGVVNRLTG